MTSIGRFTSHWWLVPITAMIGYIVYAFTVPPPWAEHHKSLKLAQSFSTVGRRHFEDLTLSFQYPKDWILGERTSQEFDAFLGITPADAKASDASGETIIFSVSRSVAMLTAPKPLIPPGAEVHRNNETLFGTTLAHVVEYSWRSPDGRFRRVLTLESTDQKRCIELACSVFGPAENAAAANDRFEQLRGTFDAVLASLKFTRR